MEYLKRYIPDIERNEDREEIRLATVPGASEVVLSREQLDFVPIRTRRGPLIIRGQRWYMRLTPRKQGEVKRSRALMEDHPLDELTTKLVICYTVDRLPNYGEGEFRIYSLFDSYIQFSQYVDGFPEEERCFYEIVFGEFPQKPHFDIDISRDVVEKEFPGEDMDVMAAKIINGVITSCIDVLREKGREINIEKDILLFNSHGLNKRSYHLVITNHCHDGNDEAKAFYSEVLSSFCKREPAQYRIFIDQGVYSPRQQFRVVGSQKIGSKRPKKFEERFIVDGREYTHQYPEDISDQNIKQLTILYESLLGFTAGCSFLPPFIAEKRRKRYTDSLDQPDLEEPLVNQCVGMLQDRKSFSILSIVGRLITLKRVRPSNCPNCNRVHENENSYIFVIDGRVYWNCRRSEANLLIGYLAVESYSPERTSNGDVDTGEGVVEDEEEEEGVMMFGSFKLTKREDAISSSQNKPDDVVKHLPPTDKQRSPVPPTDKQRSPVPPTGSKIPSPQRDKISCPIPNNKLTQNLSESFIADQWGRKKTEELRKKKKEENTRLSFQIAALNMQWSAYN